MRTHLIRSALIAAALAFSFCGAALAGEQEIVSYRLVRWKTVHFSKADEAAAHVAAFKRLGCEVRQDAHAGHIDVSYRCPQWKQGAVASHAAAEEWENWLRKAGFETRHAH